MEAFSGPRKSWAGNSIPFRRDPVQDAHAFENYLTRLWLGHPTNYLSNPALDVMKAIPSVWDETVVLPGSEIGKCAAFARRSGKTWFIGVINGGDATALDFPLDFPARGNYQMTQLGDAPDRTDGWQRDEKVVTRKDHVKLSLRPSGGCVIELNPQK